MAQTGFRDLYGSDGPEGYYRAHGDDYANPHEPAVAAAIRYAVGHHAIDFTSVLDLAAGSGEATLALLALVPDALIEAFDPYTHRAYERRTDRPCLPVSFEEIATGAHTLGRYSCVVCSCALHLAGDSWLAPLCLALASAAPDLLVLTPLTRPELRPAWGWQLMQASSHTHDERTVRLRWYRSTLFG